MSSFIQQTFTEPGTVLGITVTGILPYQQPSRNAEVSGSTEERRPLHLGLGEEAKGEVTPR